MEEIETKIGTFGKWTPLKWYFIVLAVVTLLFLPQLAKAESGTLVIDARTTTSASISGAFPGTTYSYFNMSTMFFQTTTYTDISYVELRLPSVNWVWAQEAEATTFTIISGGTGSGSASYNKNSKRIYLIFTEGHITSSPVTLSFVNPIYQNVTCPGCVATNGVPAISNTNPVQFAGGASTNRVGCDGSDPGCVATSDVFTHITNDYLVTYSSSQLGIIANVSVDKTGAVAATKINVSNSTASKFLETTFNTNSFSNLFVYDTGIAINMTDSAGDFDFVVVNSTNYTGPGIQPTPVPPIGQFNPNLTQPTNGGVVQFDRTKYIVGDTTSQIQWNIADGDLLGTLLGGNFGWNTLGSSFYFKILSNGVPLPIGNTIFGGSDSYYVGTQAGTFNFTAQDVGSLEVDLYGTVTVPSLLDNDFASVVVPSPQVTISTISFSKATYTQLEVGSVAVNLTGADVTNNVFFYDLISPSGGRERTRITTQVKTYIFTAKEIGTYTANLIQCFDYSTCSQTAIIKSTTALVSASGQGGNGGGENLGNISFSKGDYVYPIPDTNFVFHYNIPSFQPGFQPVDYTLFLFSPGGFAYTYTVVLPEPAGGYSIPIPINDKTGKPDRGIYQVDISAFGTDLVYHTVTNRATANLSFYGFGSSSNGYQIAWNKSQYNISETAMVNISIPAGQSAYYTNYIEKRLNSPNPKSYYLVAPPTQNLTQTYYYQVPADYCCFGERTKARLTQFSIDDPQNGFGIVYNESITVINPFTNPGAGMVSISWYDKDANSALVYYSDSTNNFSTVTITRPDGSIFYSNNQIQNVSGQIPVNFDLSGVWRATITDNGNAGNTMTATYFQAANQIVKGQDEYFIWTDEAGANNPQLSNIKDWYYQGDPYNLIWKLNRSVNLSVISGLQLIIQDPSGNVTLSKDLKLSIENAKINGGIISGAFTSNFRINEKIGNYTAKIVVRSFVGDQITAGTQSSFWDAVACNLVQTFIEPIGLQAATTIYFGNPCTSVGSAMANISQSGGFYEDVIIAKTDLRPSIFQINTYKTNLYGELLNTKLFNSTDAISVKFTSTGKNIKLYLYDSSGNQQRFLCQGTGSNTLCSDKVSIQTPGTYTFQMREEIDKPVLASTQIVIVQGVVTQQDRNTKIGNNLLNFMSMAAFWGLLLLVLVVIACASNEKSSGATGAVAFIVANIEAIVGLFDPFTLYIIVITWIIAGIFFTWGRMTTTGAGVK